jgi:hypothetical protein
LPIKVAFDSTAVRDTALIWKYLHAVEDEYGAEMYVAATYDEVVSVVPDVGYPTTHLEVHGLLVKVGPSQSSNQATDGKGRIVGGVFMYSDASSIQDPYLAMTYFWKTLGPVATCNWPSVVPCRSDFGRPTSGATLNDVVYTRLAHSVGNVQYEKGAQLGLYSALLGYNYAKEHNLPRPSL